jgi:hypothetical protein
LIPAGIRASALLPNSLIPAGITDAGYSIIAARQVAQREEQEDRGRGVEEQVRQMMSPRLEAEELAIQHVRNGGERMPVTRMNMGESPLNPARRKTIGDR